MAREKEAYRDTLEDILTFFDGKRVLRPFEVAKYTGLDPRTVRKRYPFKDGFIGAAVLARELS